MKLATSTGDFSWYVDTVPEKVKCFKGSGFKNINLEITGTIPCLSSENEEDWKDFADELEKAREEAGLSYVVAHAPCLHKAVLNALQDPSDETYRSNIRAIRRSIEICNVLGIKRIVVHACSDSSFSVKDFCSHKPSIL